MYYRVCHIALTFLIWLKMTFKCIVQMKARRFYNHIDPQFDMEHQLMSADPYPVTKLTWCKQSIFHCFSNYFYLKIWVFLKVDEQNLVWVKLNKQNYLYFSVVKTLDPFFDQKLKKIPLFQFCQSFYNFIKKAKNDQKWPP